MKKIFLLVFVVVAAGMSIAAPGDKYALGPGDVISIQVFDEPDLSFPQIRLTEAGTFSYPFVGEVNAKGHTLRQVQSYLTRKLRGDYLVSPKVTMRILEYRDFYINGEVKRAGGYPFKPGLTLRKAVALAGGFTERASKDKIAVIRDNDPAKRPVRLSLESPIYPGDIITINQSFF